VELPPNQTDYLPRSFSMLDFSNDSWGTIMGETGIDCRRASPRRRTVLQARVVFNNRSSIFDCAVRDLSDTGARIYFADASALPVEFELEIPNRGVRARARVVWSQGANHGVEFLEEVRVWRDPAHTRAA
jgi:PilZ domain